MGVMKDIHTFVECDVIVNYKDGTVNTVHFISVGKGLEYQQELMEHNPEVEQATLRYEYEGKVYNEELTKEMLLNEYEEDLWGQGFDSNPYERIDIL